jgi:hypothetical protein
MFRSVARVTAVEWGADGWQRAKNPIVSPWDKDSSPAKSILNLCEAWLKKETLPGAFQTILSSVDHQPRAVESAIEGKSILGMELRERCLLRNPAPVRAMRLAGTMTTPKRSWNGMSHCPWKQ